jgi:hypothetical protein
MGPLEPPRVVTTTGVTYRPGSRVLPLPLVVFLPLLALPFGPEPTAAALAIGLAAMPLFGWASEATIRAHELVIARSWLGFPVQERSYPWSSLLGAEVGAHGRLLLTTVRGERRSTSVWGSPGQVAWIAGEINVRARRAADDRATTDPASLVTARRQVAALKRAALDRHVTPAG